MLSQVVALITREHIEMFLQRQLARDAGESPVTRRSGLDFHCRPHEDAPENWAERLRSYQLLIGGHELSEARGLLIERVAEAITAPEDG